MIQIVFQGIVGTGNWGDYCSWAQECDCWSGYGGSSCTSQGSYSDCIENLAQR